MQINRTTLVECAFEPAYLFLEFTKLPDIALVALFGGEFGRLGQQQRPEGHDKVAEDIQLVGAEIVGYHDCRQRVEEDKLIRTRRTGKRDIAHDHHRCILRESLGTVPR